jgi:hypothetical protein
LIALRARHLGRDSRPTIALGSAQERPRLFDARNGDLEIEIVRKRALDQAIELGILELLPPRGLERLLCDAGALRRDERRSPAFRACR